MILPLRASEEAQAALSYFFERLWPGQDCCCPETETGESIFDAEEPDAYGAPVPVPRTRKVPQTRTD